MYGFISIPWDHVTCLSHARCLFKSPHWLKDRGLQVEQEFVNSRPLFLQQPSALFWILVCMPSMSGKTPHHTLYHISGKRPCSAQCGCSGIIQSPGSLQEAAGSALTPPWSLDTICAKVNCRGTNRRGYTHSLYQKPHHVQAENVSSSELTFQSAALREFSRVWAVNLW